ncbi:flagellar hook-basal body complex protein FliE [Sphingopyxis panaciterrae]|uniref:flagellar hook-basal body complex protein FliE n=1 Tax=Sphingopyxis panaciterrae TaxID=363841 RepID=UPI001421B79C|nr:flagellar hook-basal body complex protein FliE [Sphingopyxis panaciterrae]NIJ36966.1 flagellar hook-basal body complex protein FliE [Sphingopyxis panaciterrae]
MTAVLPISPASVSISIDPAAGAFGAAPAKAATTPATFESLLTGGLQAVDAKLARSEALVRQFTVDDTLPLHQVTIALEEARLAVEMAMQVRARLVEGYRELMNMQL